MLEIDQTVREIQGQRPDALPAEVLTSTQPLLLRGLVADWPLVAEGKKSPSAAADYLLGFYSGTPVGVGVGAPEISGRFFYDEDMSGFNFDRSMTNLDQVLSDVLRHAHVDKAPSIYVASTEIESCLPGLREENDVSFGGLAPLANIWLGSRSRIAAHWDLPHNLACCAVGRRRFTLFPPEELENLYVGPLHFTPAGQQISLVDFHNPDLDRFPKFRKALRSARVANLEPGDAIFVPAMWWHHVEALESLNVLINYWWRSTPGYSSTPVAALKLALLAIRSLPPEQREVWRNYFEYYVFGADDSSFEHIPVHARGPLGLIDEKVARMLRADLLNMLNR